MPGGGPVRKGPGNGGQAAGAAPLPGAAASSRAEGPPPAGAPGRVLPGGAPRRALPGVPPDPAAARVRLALPALPHPLLAPGEWAEPLRADAGVHWAVLDVDNGPGQRPDPDCLLAAGRISNARRRRGPGAALVLGRLDLAHGAANPHLVLAQARAWRDWYRVDGYYVRRCPSDAGWLPAVTSLLARVRALGPAHVVLGHGVHPHPGYADLAAQLVTFAGPWSRYRWSRPPEWTADLPADRFCHLVHSLPATRVDEALRLARWQGAGTVLLTDRRPREPQEEGEMGVFAALPGYWDEIVSRNGRGVSE